MSNDNKIGVLYLSYDGMTDSLGQSQVLPYLIGLAKLGYTITIISFEKEDNFNQHQQRIHNLCHQHQLIWHPLSYTKKPPVLSTLYDVYRLKQTVKKYIIKNNIKIIHCRSYITALIGLWSKKHYGTKFVFDMRGFWADERIDGGLWNLRNLLYKRIYTYFKQKEIQFLQQADYTISLTHNAKAEILSWKEFSQRPIPIKVIPCCVDLTLFDVDKISQTNIEAWQKKLRINSSDVVLCYLGSVGTWYLLDEMLQFFKQLRTQLPNAKFLFINKDEQERIQKAAAHYQILDAICIQAATREQVPELVCLAQISIFFIMPSYSKKASSPTKQGELMAMGIPVICNKGVGDTDYVVKNYNSGYLVDIDSYDAVINTITQQQYHNHFSKQKLRDGAINYFSLEQGIKSYEEVYRAILR